MAEVYQCRACGGNVIPDADGKSGVCAFCGKRMVFPRYGLRLMNQANQLRARMEFEQAEALYQSLALLYPDDPEIWWNILLCNYGVLYVQEQGRRVITVNRMKLGRISDEEAYQKALSLAEPQQRQIYEEEGRTIQAIQDRLVKAAGQEEAYDIFISFKDKDESGQRTIDSVLAQDIYDRLTDEGYKVFFSRITLRTAIGEEFEPKIFAALQSARMMVLVANTPENVASNWVRNEWSRYLKLMEKDAGKFLLPVYTIGVRPEQLPSALAGIEGIQANGEEYLETLVNNVNNRFGRKKAAPMPAGAAVAQSAQELHWQQIQLLMNKGQEALEQDRYDDASEYYEDVLDLDVTVAAAWWGKIAAATLNFLSPTADIYGNPKLKGYYEQAMMYATPEDEQRFRQDLARLEDSKRAAHCAKLYNDYAHLHGCSKYFCVEEENYPRAQQLLQEAITYADEERRQELEEELQRLRFMHDNGKAILHELEEIESELPYNELTKEIKDRKKSIQNLRARQEKDKNEFGLDAAFVIGLVFLAIGIALTVIFGGILSHLVLLVGLGATGMNLYGFFFGRAGIWPGRGGSYKKRIAAEEAAMQEVERELVVAARNRNAAYRDLFERCDEIDENLWLLLPKYVKDVVLHEEEN